MLPCLTLNIIRYGSGVKWSNPGKGVAPSLTLWCRNYWKGSFWFVLDYEGQLLKRELLGRPWQQRPTIGKGAFGSPLTTKANYWKRCFWVTLDYEDQLLERELLGCPWLQSPTFLYFIRLFFDISSAVITGS